MIDYQYIQALSQMAGSLLLNSPEQALIDHINQSHSLTLSLEESQKAFNDTMVFAHSGLFIPPFEHVCNQVSNLEGNFSFPMAKFDGGDKLNEIYQQFHFNPANLSVTGTDLRKHLPLDHFGYILLFISHTFNAANLDSNSASYPLLISFLEHRLAGLAFYQGLLATSQQPYICFVSELLADTLSQLELLIKP
ncbi:hypothetical protein L0B53_00770 [Vibrio sp. SS-MA-C1-2]|uniref:hypothetical protein n=1 Tax=Vibrio sp. SS-MA-C1-2 TaxID=2908646 RepID=UPI001F3C97C6|nr:hypothetical protein [Vibrio sp. SS-MA-C1-2]UJF17343.1 hypothetical protein L0B53_00770 [Vibrio sp. SS-MA-C1-2]